jgi:hypothetical protein
MTDSDRSAVIRVLKNAVEMLKDGTIRDVYDCGLISNSIRQELEIQHPDPNEVHRVFDRACRAGHIDPTTEHHHEIIVKLMD